jgi:very-short-patch-repair endonuclease
MPDRARYSRVRGVVVHRPRDLVDLRPVLRSQVPTTNPLRMLVDLGAVDEGAVRAAMIAVMASKVASPTAIRAALLRHARSGRHGVTALRLALEEWIDDELPPDSELEVRMARLIRNHRLPDVQFHAIVEGYEVDFLVVGTRVILECDGWGSHGLDRDQFEFDRIRNAELLAAGYVVVHFTWKRLHEHPARIAQRIRQVLARWAA